MKLPGFIGDFISLLFPRVCTACGNTLIRNEDILCTFCLYELPRTNYHLMKECPLDFTFRGRVRLERTAALYTFHKKGKVQHLIHQLKYNGRKDVGVYLGKLLGSDLLRSGLYQDVVKVIPVPLHHIKLRKRGYNQSEQFAIGISEAMHIEMDTSSLIRTINTDTQTKKTRLARWENVKDIFKVTTPEALTDKHILLVDDVITTGATLESAAKALLQVEGVKISIACIGHARGV